MKMYRGFIKSTAKYWFPALVAMVFMASAAQANISFTAAGSSGVNGNSGNWRVGNDFSVSGDGITITSLGIFAINSHALSISHPVNLYVLTGDDAGAVVGSVVVPAGTGGVLDGSAGSGNGFRFVALDTPIYLPAGTRGSVVGYGFYAGANFTTDTYGKGAGLPTGNVAWYGHDRYNNDSFGGLPTYQGGDNAVYAAGSFLYTDGPIVPEPASLGVLGLGATMLLARRRRKI